MFAQFHLLPSRSQTEFDPRLHPGSLEAMLYIVRHAHAVSEEEDSARPLSKRGREQANRLARFLVAQDLFAPAEIWHSPLVRVRQTAEIFASAMRTAAPLVETPGMLPEDTPRLLAKRLAERKASGGLAVVGHEPYLSALATLLVFGSTSPAAFRLRKGSVLALDRATEAGSAGGERRWVVQWLVGPELQPD
ncbi:hypothetical protein DB347_19740 [Opitutaceae bacterium EW11]|nr:hypothetical protein DB347_19740 [Opitutaceae bacterium EW11]